MQTIYLDISNKGVYPCIYAKQGDVDRKFLLVVTDNGVPFDCEDKAISVWYDGDSGEGNYTHIGEKDAIIVDGNKITVSLIQQMIVNAGDGVLSVSVSDASGSQIGLWNIEYCVEQKPGAESKKATQYYDAFSQTAADIAKSVETIGKTQERIDSIIKAKNATAAGLIYPLASANVPSGFLLCDGAEYSRTEYSELFDAIGTVYGEGDGSTTFNVPNLSTRVPVGIGDGYALGQIGGAETHKLSIDEIPEHQHKSIGILKSQYDTWEEVTLSGNTITHDSYDAAGTTIKRNFAENGETDWTGGSQPHNNMQPYTVVNYIISTGKEVEFVVGGTGSPGVSGGEDAVLYTEQTLTEEQQAQARENIGAFAKSDVFQTTGNSETAVMSQKAVSDNLNFWGYEITLEWYRKTVAFNSDGSAIPENDIVDNITRLLNRDVASADNFFDISGKTITVSVANGYKYACALYRTGRTAETITHLTPHPSTPWKYYTEPTTWNAVDDEYKYLVIMLAKADNSEILPEEASAITIKDGNCTTNGVKESILRLQEDVVNLKSAPLNGKKWLFVGDSITEHNFRATKNYDEYLQDWLGIVPVNVGMSGTGVTYPFGGNPSWLGKMAEYPADIDVISVMGALNDRHTTLGEWGDKGTDTVYGAVWNYFNNLIEMYPNKPIIYITSTPREYSYGVDGQYTAWVDAFIKTAHNFSIPVLDLYRNSGLRPWNATHNAEYFSCSNAPTGDGVHPNEKGQKLIALKIAEFAKQFLSE